MPDLNGAARVDDPGRLHGKTVESAARACACLAALGPHQEAFRQALLLVAEESARTMRARLAKQREAHHA